MRLSAEIGSENSTRSTRVRRANSTRSSTEPSFGQPAAEVRRALVAAIVEHAEQAHVGIFLRAERVDQRFARLAAADQDGAAVEPAFAAPAPDLAVEHEARDVEREEAEAEEAREPDARVEVAEPREEHHGHERQEDERPRDGQLRELVGRAGGTH